MSHDTEVIKNYLPMMWYWCWVIQSCLETVSCNGVKNVGHVENILSMTIFGMKSFYQKCNFHVIFENFSISNTPFDKAIIQKCYIKSVLHRIFAEASGLKINAENVWRIVCFQFYCGDYGVGHQRFVCLYSSNTEHISEQKKLKTILFQMQCQLPKLVFNSEKYTTMELAVGISTTAQEVYLNRDIR